MPEEAEAIGEEIAKLLALRDVREAAVAISQHMVALLCMIADTKEEALDFLEKWQEQAGSQIEKHFEFYNKQAVRSDKSN